MGRSCEGSKAEGCIEPGFTVRPVALEEFVRQLGLVRHSACSWNKIIRVFRGMLFKPSQDLGIVLIIVRHFWDRTTLIIGIAAQARTTGAVSGVGPELIR